MSVLLGHISHPPNIPPRVDIHYFSFRFPREGFFEEGGERIEDVYFCWRNLLVDRLVLWVFEIIVLLGMGWGLRSTFVEKTTEYDENVLFER